MQKMLLPHDWRRLLLWKMRQSSGLLHSFLRDHVLKVVQKKAAL